MSFGILHGDELEGGEDVIKLPGKLIQLLKLVRVPPDSIAFFYSV
jgi:hypothetical protein